jgi:hypothetical protein
MRHIFKFLLLALFTTGLMAQPNAPVQVNDGYRDNFTLEREMLGVRLGMTSKLALDIHPSLELVREAKGKGPDIYAVKWPDDGMSDSLYVAMCGDKVCGIWLVLGTKWTEKNMGKVLWGQKRTRARPEKDDFTPSPSSQRVLTWRDKNTFKAFYQTTDEEGKTAYVIAITEKKGSVAQVRNARQLGELLYPEKLE